MKQLLMIMVIFAYPRECNLNWLSGSVLTHTFLFVLCRYSAQPVSILHCLPADDCSHCDVYRWGLCHSSLQFAQVRFVWLFTMIYTCEVCVALQCSLHARFVSLLAVMCSMRFVSLCCNMHKWGLYDFTVVCWSQVCVTVYCGVHICGLCLGWFPFFKHFSCLLLPTVLVHFYGVIGISLLEWSVCTHTHTHTHTQVCLFQTVTCCSG
jgi:hypothetical protein